MNVTDRTLILWPLVLLLASGCTRSCNNSQNGGSSPLYADHGFQFPSGFPNDPGEAGKKSIEGIDSDRDGLRDDLQRWIYARYPDDEPKRKALRQMAQSFQAETKPPASLEDTYAHAKRITRAIECLSQHFPSEDSADPGQSVFSRTVEMEYVRAKTLNTRGRTEQYLETDTHYDGKVFKGLTEEEKRTACDP